MWATRPKRFRPPIWVPLVFLLVGVTFVWLGFLIIVSGVNSGQSTDFLFRAALVSVSGVTLAGVGLFIRALRRE